MIATMPYRKPFTINYKWLWAIALLALFALFVSISTIEADNFTGGYVSDTLISRTGVTDSNFLINSSGTTGSGVDIATVGTITTNPATGIGTASTDLHATVSTLNGMPRGVVYFEWGYDSSYGNVTASTTITAPGDVTIPVAGYNPTKNVYYRAVVETDGTAKASPRYFAVGGMVVGRNIMSNIVLLMVALAMVITTIGLFRTDIDIMELVGIIVVMGVLFFVIKYIIDML